jgi:PST family polysaccharide transporter
VELGKKSVQAFKWGALSTTLRFTLQFAVQVALARMLGPEYVGLFALATLVVLLTNFVADFGFGWCLVQKKNVDPQDIRFAFTYQLITGCVSGVALFVAAPLISTVFTEPRLQPLIQWLCLACPLTAAAAPANNLLRRDMNFRAIGLIQLSSYAIGYVGFGLPLAILGAGVWSLVVAWLVQATIVSIVTFVKHPHEIRPLFWYAGGRDMVSVSSTVFVTNLCNWFLNNLDRMVLGRMTDVRAVGHYATAYNLANLPNVVLSGVLNPTFLAAGARLQDDRVTLKSAYLQLLAAVWVLVSPLFTLLAVCAPSLVLLLYGVAWERTGHLLLVLAFAMPASLTLGVTTPVLWNTGRKVWEVLIQLPILIVLVAVLVLWGGQGPEKTALVVVTAYFVRAWFLCWAALRTLAIGADEWGSDLARGLGLSLIVAAFGSLARVSVDQLNSQLISLLATGSAGLGAIIAVAVLRPRWLGLRANKVIVRFAPWWQRHLEVCQPHLTPTSSQRRDA